MTLGKVLNIGAAGLASSAANSAIASNNIANATTPGYTRRMALIHAVSLEYGGGARTVGAIRVEDRLLETRLLGSNSLLGEADARARTLGPLDQVLSDQPGGVINALDEFESALAALAASPSEPATREVVMTRLEQLTQAFNRAGDDLAQTRTDANTYIMQDVARANTSLNQIGDLTRQIVETQMRGVDPSPLIDQRDELIRQVAQILPVTIVQAENGAVEVLLNGSYTLVDKTGSVHELNVAPNSNGDAAVFRNVAGMQQDVTALLISGSLAGAIAARDGALTDAEDALNQLASDVVTAYNAVHVAGFGADGGSGRNMFDPAGVTARTMAVSADIAGQPEALAAASAAGLSGDNTNAVALSALRDANLALSGSSTASGAFASLIARAGTQVQSAYMRQEHARTVLEQVEMVREQVSGVNLDEEMIAMMRFQRAYQASLRVIEIADSLLGELLNLR